MIKTIITAIALTSAAFTANAGIENQYGSCRIIDSYLSYLSVEQGIQKPSGWRTDPAIGSTVYFSLTSDGGNDFTFKMSKQFGSDDAFIYQGYEEGRGSGYSLSNSEDHFAVSSGSSSIAHKFHIVRTVDNTWEGHYVQTHLLDWAIEVKQFKCSYYPTGKGRVYINKEK